MSFKDWKIGDVERHNQRVNSGSKKQAVARTPPDPTIKPRKPAYTPEQVKAWCKENGLPEPVFEHRFHPARKWRFDIAWDVRCHAGNIHSYNVACEIQGGLWIRGGHNRGAQMKADWEKLHEAQLLGWKMIYVEPKDLLTKETADLVKKMLKF